MPWSKIIKTIRENEIFTGRIKFFVELLISRQDYVGIYQPELRNTSIWISWLIRTIINWLLRLGLHCYTSHLIIFRNKGKKLCVSMYIHHQYWFRYFVVYVWKEDSDVKLLRITDDVFWKITYLSCTVVSILAIYNFCTKFIDLYQPRELHT